MLQRAVFPWYFGIQAVGPAVLALTYPGSRSTVLGALEGTGPAARGIAGVLARANRWAVLAPLAVASVAGLVNWAYLLPETNKITALRRAQGTCGPPPPKPSFPFFLSDAL